MEILMVSFEQAAKQALTKGARMRYSSCATIISPLCDECQGKPFFFSRTEHSEKKKGGKRKNDDRTKKVGSGGGWR